MTERILIAGFGGQGVMLLGRIIAETAIKEGMNVAYLKSYGAEMRGGTANCLVQVSSQDIFSPIFSKSSAAIILNQPSFEKFKNAAEKKGMLIINSSLIKVPSLKTGVLVKPISLNEIAKEAGSLKSANIAVLGFLLKVKPFLSLDAAVQTIKTVFSGRKALIEINLRALEKGYNYG